MRGTSRVMCPTVAGFPSSTLPFLPTNCLPAGRTAPRAVRALTITGTFACRWSAYTFSTGVDITTILGISLSAQTGYDTDTTVAFHVDHGNHMLCGTNTFPGNYPDRAQWGKKR